VRKSNAPALAFWSRVVHSKLGRAVEPRSLVLSGVEWIVFCCVV
jgi:hypothetical protein